MKKLLLSALGILSVVGMGFSQITNYGMAPSAGTFTPISGGTVVAAVQADDAVSAALPLGFTFNFNGTNYTDVVASSNGFLSFNAAAGSNATNNLATSAATARPLVAPLWDDMNGNVGSAKYVTTGTAPNRVFTFEWLNWKWNWQATAAVISFQVKLYEGTNVVEFVYQQEAAAYNAGFTNGASIGIAAAGTGAGNYLSLDNSSVAPVVSSTAETTSIATKPATGQIYAFGVASLPPTPTQVSPTVSCLLGTDLVVAGTPNANETWYWQTSATGTSTANNASTPWTVFANGTYYVRTFNSQFNVWSTATSIVVSDVPTATPPPAPTASVSPACLNSTMVAATPPSGTTYYWQTAVNGTSNANDAATPLPVTATGDYYLAAFETASGCWSNTSSGNVVINTIIPANPVVTQATYDLCGGLASYPISAQALAPQGPGTQTTSFGTNFTCTGTPLTVPLTVPALPPGAVVNSASLLVTTATAVNGSWRSEMRLALNGIYTLPATGLSGLNSAGLITPDPSVNLPGYSVVNGGLLNLVISESFDDAGVDDATYGNIQLIINYTIPNISYEWFDAPTGGTSFGSTNPLEALGTSEMPTATTGSYQFYAQTNQDACTSAGRTLVTINVNEVDVVLSAIDETCIGYEDGSFALGTVNCGDAPFTYSVDGGTFGSIPTDLAAGTYSVVVKDNNGNESGVYSVVIGSASTVIPTDVLANPDEYFYCTSDVSVTVAAQGPFQSATCTTPVTNVSGNDNVITPTVTDFTCPTGTITGATLNAAYTGSFCGSWYWFDIEVNGNIVATDQCNTTTFDLTPYLPLTEVKVISKDHPNDGIIDFVTMNVSVTMEYDVVMPGATVAWYDAPTAGTQLGTSPSGAPFELIGTTVLPTNAAGSYPVYAVGKIGGCYSVNSTEVTATVSEVHQTFTIIDATCNNGDNGSFTPLTFECGSAPFSYSVDGGTFGTIPTNLTTGTHTVQVQDGGGELSAIYTITVGSADGPSDATVEAFSFDTAHVYWTPNGSETSWNIEWGPVGFTPGTGTQTGMANVADTFFTIIGLDGDTEYDIYVSADCGGTTTPGDWDMTSVQTTCDPVAILPFCESFESDSPTIQCWKVIDDNNDGTAWGLYNDPTLANTGDFSAAINTDFNNGANSDYLVMPMITLTGNEVLTFNYRTYSDFEPNDVQVLISTTGSNPADFQDTLLNLFTVGEEFYKDTMANLSAFTGNVYIAFNVPNGGLDGWILFIDDVCVDVCIPNPGTDGDIDVCRLDGTVDLDAVITSDYIDGSWIFPANQSVVNGSTLNVSTLAATSFDILYVKTTACTSDTTIATVNIFNESNAGNDGTLSVCRNEPVDLLSGITSGTIDLGGDWYNPSSQLLPSSAIVANNVPGQYNYTYITGNGVCPDDTSSIILNVSSTCDYLNVEEMVFAEMSVYPNPSNGVFNIANESSSVFSYEVLDVEGRLVERKEAAVGATSVTSIDMTGKVTGIYMIRVYNSEADKVFRVVLQ